MSADIVSNLAAGKALSRAQSESLITQMLSGELNDDAIATTLSHWADKGETTEEILGAVDACSSRMIRVTTPPNAIDNCGTGGDGLNTYNISTAAALVVAACGLPVAKHGNRAVSSKSGSADVLQALGATLELAPSAMESIAQWIGFGFFLAPIYHPAMAAVANARRSLKRRTIFNLLGPLLNPASVRYQLLGVAQEERMSGMADILRAKGMLRGWVVRGEDGMDELSISGASKVLVVEEHTTRPGILTPEKARLPQHKLSELTGGDAAYNAAALTDMLSGAKSAYRDAVIYNAAGCLVMAGASANMAVAAEQAAMAIDEGDAKALLKRFIEETRKAA